MPLALNRIMGLTSSSQWNIPPERFDASRKHPTFNSEKLSHVISPENISPENPSIPEIQTDIQNASILVNDSLISWYLTLGVPETWIKEHLTEPPSNNVHMAMGILISIIGIAGGTGNALVLLVYARFQRFRSPSNTFIVNLAASDFLSALFHIMAAYSSFCGRWMFEKSGCQIYAAGIGLLGLVSIVTLLCISVERLIVIRPYLYPKMRITTQVTHKVILGIWLYCIALAFPPLFGWSSYIPEGFLTSCSWDYLSRTTSNRAYYIYLLVGGFVLPCSAIVYCYSCILVVLFNHAETNGKKKTTERIPLLKRNDIKTAQMVFTLIVLFTISWTPYATVSLIGQFGDANQVTAKIASLPALFAKASIIYNPIVYGMSHPHFKSSLRSFIHASSSSSSNNHRHANCVASSLQTRPYLKHAVHARGRSSDDWQKDKDKGQCTLSYCFTGEVGIKLVGLKLKPLFSSKSESENKPRIGSEPDLLRLDELTNESPFLYSDDYRRVKRKILQETLFCSEPSLEVYNAAKARTKVPEGEFESEGRGKHRCHPRCNRQYTSCSHGLQCQKALMKKHIVKENSSDKNSRKVIDL